MTGEELSKLGRDILGYGWRRKLARLLEVHEYTVHGWARGESPIRRIHAIAIMWVLSQAAEEKEGGSAGNSPSA